MNYNIDILLYIVISTFTENLYTINLNKKTPHPHVLSLSYKRTTWQICVHQFQFYELTY